MQSQEDYVKKLLGVVSLDENNLPKNVPTGKYYDPTSAEVLKNYNRNPQFRENFGDFSGGVGWDPDARDGVIYRGEDQDYLQDRYNSQRGFARFRYATGRLVGTTATKFLSGVGFLGALAAEIPKSTIDLITNGDTFEGNAISRASNNWFSNMMEGAEEGIKNYFPIFQGRKYLEGNWLQKATTSEFWASDLVDGLAFAASSYIPGGVLAKAGIGSKLALTAGKSAQSLSKVHPALKFLYKNPQAAISLTQDLTGLSRKIDKFASYATMTSMEAMFEAKEVRDAIMNNPELWSKYDAETIREIAAEKAANTFALNMAFLAPSNLLEVSSIFNKTKFLERVDASRTNKSILFDSATKQFTETPLTGFQRFAKNPWTKLGKDFISNAAAEGFYEENIQYLISTLNQYNALKEDPQGVLANFGELLSIAPGKMFGDISDEQAQSILLGSAIGTGSTVGRNIPGLNKLFGGDGGVFTEEKQSKESTAALLKDLNSNQDLRKLDVFKRLPASKVSAKIDGGKYYITVDGQEKEVDQTEYTRSTIAAGIDPATGGEGEISRLELDSEGNPIVDSDKLSNLVVEHLRDSELEDFHNALSNHSEKNQASLSIIRNSKLARLGYKYFSQGLGSQLFDMIDSLSSADDESLELLGVLAPLDKNKAVGEAKKVLADLEEVYNSVERGMLNAGGNEKKFIERKKTAYDVGTRAVILDGITNTFMKQAAESARRSVVGYEEDKEIADNLKKIEEIQTQYNELYEKVTSDPTAYGIGSSEREQLNKLALTAIDLLYPIADKIDSLSNKKINREAVLKYEEGLTPTSMGLTDPFTEAYRNTRAALEAVRSLQDSRQQLFEEWTNLTDLTSGQEYYDKNYENLSRKDASKDFSPKLVLDGKVTLSKYTSWEKRMKSIFTLRKRLDQIHQQYLGGLVEEWRTGHLSLGEIVDYMISNRVRMRKEFPTFKFNRAYNDIVNRLAELQSRYSDLLAEEGSTNEPGSLVHSINEFKQQIKFFIDSGIKNEADKLEASIKEVEDRLQQVQNEKAEIETELGSVLTQDLDKLTETIEGFNAIDFFKLSDNAIVKQIADTFKENSTSVIDAFNTVDSYEDLDSIEESIIELENLKKIFEQREDVLATKEFSGFIDELDTLLEQLRNIRDKVEERIFDRNKKERRKVNQENNRLFQLLGIDAITGKELPNPTKLQKEVQSILGDELWAKILKSISDSLKQARDANDALPKEQQTDIQANDVFIDIVLEILRSANTSTKENLLALLDKNNEAILGKVKNLPFIEKQLAKQSKLPDKRKSTSNYLNVALFNPLRSFRAITRSLGQIVIIGLEQDKNRVGYDSKKESSLYRFYQTQDFFSLIEDLEKGTETRPTEDFTSEDLLALSKLYLELYLNNTLRQGIETNISSVNLISKELSEVTKEQKNKTDNKPFSWPASISQRATIYNILKFFGKPLTYPMGSKYDSFMYLRGPAGSGKTNLVVRWVLKLLPGITLKNVIASGHNLDSAANLGKSIGLEKEAMSIADLTKQLNDGKIDDTISLLVVDEIGAVGTIELGKFAEAVKAHTEKMQEKNPNYTLKVLVMGDSNQVTSDVAGYAGIEQGYGAESATNATIGIENVVDISPLYIRFRSDIPSINNIQDAFIDNHNKVTKLTGITNVLTDDIASTKEEIKGSFIDNAANNLASILINNINNSPNRTRAIVVEDETNKNVWSNKLKSLGVKDGAVEVLTYKEVQGKTISEVYVVIKDDTFKTYRDFNQAMYTATSRAVDFLYVGYIDNNKNITDLNLISKLDKVKTSKDSNFDSSIKELQEKLVILKQFDLSISEQEEEEDQDDREDEEEQEDTDTPNPQPTPPTTPTSPTSGVVETKEEEPEAIPDETITEEDVEDIEIVEEEEPTTGNTFQHKVTTDDNIGNPPASSNKFSIPIGAPSHDSFYEVTDPNTGEVVFKGIKALTPTDPVYIVKANTRERDAENKPAGFLVVTPTKKNGLYSLLGILTEAEQELHKEKLVDSAPIIYTRDNSYPDADSLVNIPIDLDNSNSITVTLDQDATTPITYNYVSRNSISPEFKPFSIARKFVDNLNSPTVVITEDGEKVQISPDSQLEVNPSTAVRIGIASKTSVPKGVKRFIPSLGHPIMLISNIVRKVGVISSNMADQVIILTPKLLNKNNKFHYEKFIKPIEDFVSSVEKMHEKLAGLNIGPEFRLGYKTTANNSTNHFSKLIANLADLYYYKNNGKELKDETYNKAYSYLEKLFGKDLRTDNSLDSLLELAVEIDTQVHGKYAEKRVRLGKGDSQKAFNAIARSNLWVLDADNPNQALVIRDAKTVETEGTKEKFERGKSKGKTVAISGRNLLGRITDYKGDFTIGNTMDPEVKKYVGRTNASYLKRTGQVGVIPSHYNGRVLTLTQLRKVISFNPTTGESDATINGGLRVPIIKRWFQGSKGEFGKTLQSINNDNLIKLTDLFDNTFVGVTPTTISLDWSSQYQLQEVKKKKVSRKKKVTPEDKTSNIDTQVVDDARLDNIDVNDLDLSLGAAKTITNPEELGEVLDEAALNKLYSQYLPETLWKQFTNWATRLVGRTSQEKELFKIIDTAAIESMAGKPVYGLFKKNMVYLEQVGENKRAYSNILIHELAHKILHNFLSSAERNLLFKAYSSVFDVDTSNERELEESLVRHIVLSKRGVRKVSWPTKVWWLIERLFSRIGFFNKAVTDLDNFLVRFHNGYFGGRELYSNDLTLPASKLEKYFNNDPESFIMSKKLVLNLLKQYWQHDARKEFLDKKRKATGNESLTIENYPPYSFKEALEQVHLNINTLAKSAEKNDTTADGLRARGIYKEVMALSANRSAFKEVVNNLFPGVLAKDIYGFEVELSDEDLEIVNISQEIKDRDLIDEVRNSLYTVKQLLSTISYVDEDTGVTSFIPFNHVFHLVAEILQSFNSQLSLDELFSSSTNWADLAFSKYPGTNKIKAVREFLSNLIYSAYSKDFYKHVDFFSEDIVYISVSKQDLTDRSFGELTKKANTKQDIVKVSKNANESHAEFLDRIMSELPNGFITKAELYEQLRLFRARNLYAQLYSSLGSLRYKDPMIGTREKDSDQRYTYRYFKGREGGTKSVLFSNFSQGIIHRYYTADYQYNSDGDVVEHLSRDEGQVFSYNERKRLTDAPPVELKGAELNRWKANKIIEFLRIIGISNVRGLLISNNPARDAEIPVLYEDMVNFIERIYKEVQKERGSIEDLVQVKERKFLSRIVARITPINNLYQPTNFIRGDGKRAYKWVQGSWINDVFKHILGNESSPVRFLAGLNLEKYPHLLTDFFKNNIFINGTNTIYDVVDHDSIKYKGLAGSAKAIRNETPFDWISRHFNYGFIGYISQRAQGKPTYVQFGDTVSNKPQSFGTPVNVLNEKELLTALQSMIKQQLIRPSAEDIKVKNYDPRKNFIFGLEWDGRSSLSDSSIKKKAKEVYEKLNKEADDTLRILLSENVLMASNIDTIYKILYDNGVLDNIENSLKDEAVRIALSKVLSFETQLEKINPDTNETEYEEVTLTDEQIKERDEKLEKLIDQANTSMSIKDKEALFAYYAPLFRTYFINNYVNSHQLRQLILGDTAFYKSGKEFYDIIKRISIAFGAGKKFIVNEALGFLPEKTKVVVVQDDKKYVDEVVGLAKELYGTSFDATDGISFITPRYWKKMRRSAGIEAELDVSLKPVYFNIDERGVPTALKFASIVLTDELVDKFPQFKKWRDLLDSSDLDMMAFESAVKVGAPSTLTKIVDSKTGEYLNSEDGVGVPYPKEFDLASIIEINNRFLRLQLNPAHDPFARSTNPSQMVYMPATNMEVNLKQHNEILELQGALINMGAKKIHRLFRLNKGKPTAATRKAVRNRAVQAWFDMGGYESLWGLVNNPDISLNLPVMTNRLIQLISSVFSKNSVDIKFKGAKLVLQPEFAVGTEVRDKDGKLLRVEDLQWRTEDGFTELYVPEAWREDYGLREGQQFETPILAFRLPSTGLHSAIKVRIKGFYPVPEGTKANIVIAPRQIVFNHGSDYDIDSLFVLLQKKVKDVFKDGNYVKDGELDLKDLLNTINPEIKTNGIPSVLLMDNFIPYSNSMKSILEQAIESIREEASSILRDMPSMKKNGTWTDEMQNRLVLLTGNFGKEEQGLEFRLMSLYNASLQNRVIELFTDVISSPGNRELMEYPITMDVLSKASQKGQEDSALDVVARMRGFERGELDGKEYANKRDELLYPKIDLSLLLHQRSIFRDVWSGAKLVGAAANFFKILAYTWTGAKVNMWEDQNGNEYTKEQLQQKDPTISRAIKEFAKEGVYLTASSKEAPMLSKDLYITGLNGVIYDGLSHNERKSVTAVETYTDENGQEQEREIIKLVDNEIVVGYDNKKKAPITRVRKVWENLDSLINAAIDNVKEQILYLVNLTSSNSNEFFAMVGLGVPLNDVVRFFNQPIFLHLAKEGKYNIDKVNLLSKKLLTNWITEDKTIFEEEIKELNKLNLQFINTPKANTELKESIRTKISELTDRMQSKGIKLLEEGYFVTSQMLEETTKNYYRNNENFDSVKGFDALVQLIVINDFRKLNVIGKRVFSASLVSNMLREIPSDYAVLSRMIDTVNDEISDIGWDDYAKEIKEAEKELKDSATYKEKKKALQNSEEYKNATTQEKRSMTYDLIQNSLSRDKAEAIFRDRRRLLNSILSFTSSDYNRASEKWPFINSSLLANPNWKEAYRQLIRVKALFQTMFFKHHRNIEEFVNNAIKYLGVEYQGSDDKYDIIEKAKTQFMNFIATKMYINLGSKETPFYSSMGIDENIKASYDIKLPGGNVATKSLYGLPAFTHLLVNRLNALAKHLSTTGKDNYFLSNLEFYFDSSSNMNKIIFTQDKMQDAVESSKFKRAFLELANEDIKAWEEGTRKQQWGEGQQYSYTQHLLLQYLMLVEGTDYGRTSFSDVIPDSMYEDLSWALEDTVKQFIAPNTKNLSEQERLAALEEYGNTDVTKALEKIKDQFILQFALNNNNQLKNLDIDKSKIKTSIFLEDGRYYDLVVPSTVKSNFITSGSGVYYRSSFDKDNSYFIRVGFRNKGKVFFLSEEIFSNGFSLNKVFNGTYFIYSQNLQGNVYTSGEFKEKKPFKVGQPVYVKYAGDITYTKVRQATVTKVEEIENEGKFQYKLTITTPTTNTIVNTAKISGLSSDLKLGKNLEFTDRSTKQSAAINLHSQIGTNYSLRDRLQELVNNSTSPFIKQNALKLLNTLSSLQLDSTTTIIDNTLKSIGRVDYGDKDTSYLYSISLNPNKITRRRDYELALLHEAYHIATITSFSIIDFSKTEGTISPELQSLYFEINNIYEIAKSQVTDSNFKYYFSNIHEFISGAFSDNQFADRLKQVNLWTRLVSWINDLLEYFGVIDRKSSYNAYEALERIMNKYLEVASKEEIRNLNTLEANLTKSSLHHNLDTPKESIDIEKAINEKTSSINLVEDTIANVYTSINGVYDRLTGYVSKVFKTVTYKNKEEERARAFAEKDFTSRNIPLDGVLVLSATEQYTLDQRVIYYDRLFNEAAAKGRILHKYIEKALSNDPARREAIDKEIAQEAERVLDKDGNVIKEQIDLNKFRWLNKKIKFIIDQAGLVVNLDDEVYDPDLVDKVYPEIMAYSDILKVASKIDGLVLHADGTLSLLDWKTGRLLSDENSGYMMKYGAAYDLNDSKLNRAKLEVVFRAMMVKEMIPEAKFRNLNINWLNYTTDLSVIPIDMQPYLNIIRDGLQATNPDAYQKLQAKGAFEESFYRAPHIKVEEWKLKNNKLSPQEQVAKIDSELRSLRARYTDADLENRPELKQRLSNLSTLRLQIESGSDTPIDVQEKNDLTDLTFIQRWTLNIKDAPSKFLQQFSKILEKRRFKFNSNFDEFQKEKEEYLLPVVKEYLQSNSMASALSFLTRDKLNYIPVLGGLNKRDLYKFMWRYQETDTMKGWYANLKDTYFDTNLGVEVELTDAQKQFRNWYHKVKNETYERVVNTSVEDRNGKASTLANVQGIDSQLYKEFMPRARASNSELLEREKLSGIPQKVWANIQEKISSTFIEEKDYGDYSNGVPIRYAPAIDSKIIEEELHTFDVERSLVGFTKQLLLKEQMDDAYVIALGLKQYYKEATDAKGNLVYKNLTAFIEDHILLDVLHAMPKENVLNKGKDLVITKKMADGVLGQQLGWKEGQIVKWGYGKFFYGLKSFTSAAGMMLRPISGAFNGALIFMTNFIRATGGTVAKLAGVEEVYYDLNTFAQAQIDWLAHLKHWSLGTDSKLEAIAHKTRYLSDNYDYFTTNKELLVTKNKVWNSSSLYYFHTMFENYGAMTMLSAQLRAQKVKMPDGTIKSMWELYDNEGNYTGPIRGVELDSVGNKTEIAGLTALEVGRLKRVYEKAHGSYRQEERVALELNVLGQWLLQFKRYLPMLWRTNLGLNREEVFLGAYKLKLDENGMPVRDNNMDVYTWEKTQTGGRIWLALRLLGGYFGDKNSPYYDKSKSWENFSNAEKQDVLAGLANVLIFGIALLAFNVGVPPEEKDKVWARRTRRLIEDISLGLNPADLIRPAVKPLPQLEKLLELWDALGDFMWRGGVTGELDQRGWPKGTYRIWRNIPIGSSIHQWNSYLKSLQESGIIIDPVMERAR